MSKQETVMYEAIGWYRDENNVMQELRGEIDPQAGVVTFARSVQCVVVRPIVNAAEQDFEDFKTELGLWGDAE